MGAVGRLHSDLDVVHRLELSRIVDRPVDDELLATLFILISAALHATWNALLKSAADRRAGLLSMGLVGSVLFLPATILVPLPDRGLWPYIAASVAAHVTYQLLLLRMFARGDYVVVYPIARGTGPVVVTVVSVVALAAPLDASDLVSIAAIVVGALLASGVARARGCATRAGLVAAVTTGLAIGSYTLVDAFGMKASEDPWTFIVWSHVPLVPTLVGLAVVRQRGLVVRSFLEHRRALIGMALCAYTGYVFALIALRWGVVAEIAALRETSIVFAAVIGVLFLREPMPSHRRWGILAIVFGAIALRVF